MQDRVREFLSQGRFAVVGASSDRSKYGNKVLRSYLQNGRDAVPIHPKEKEVEGVACFASLSAIPEGERPDAVSIITPPAVTEKVVAEALALGIRHLWMQPGAESPQAISDAQDAGANVIGGGPCVLVSLGFHE